MDAEEVAEGPTGSHLQQFLPPKDVGGNLPMAVGPIDAPRLPRSATAGVAENTYIEIDDETAVGLPEAAAA
jgi:hypothetical protein